MAGRPISESRHSGSALRRIVVCCSALPRQELHSNRWRGTLEDPTYLGCHHKIVKNYQTLGLGTRRASDLIIGLVKAQAERRTFKPQPRYIFITNLGKSFILAENKVGAKITLYNADSF